MPTSDRFLDTLFTTSAELPILSLLEATIDGAKYYYVNNNESITSTVSGTSAQYERAAFNVALPDDTDDGIPTATLEFNAADSGLVRLLRLAEDRVKIRIWLVLADDVNTVEYGPVNYESKSFSLSGSSIAITLESDSSLDVQVPGLRYTPNVFPGLWANDQA